MGYVDDLQSSLELAKKIVETTELANPIRVTYAIKQLAKDAAAGEGRGTARWTKLHPPCVVCIFRCS